MNTPDFLFPYVVPSSWVGHVGTESLASWQISDDVHVVLVFDGKGIVKNARPEDLEAIGLDEENAFNTAAFNLAKAWEREEFSIGSATLLDGIQIGSARGSWLAPAAGLLLGGFHAALSQ